MILAWKLFGREVLTVSSAAETLVERLAVDRDDPVRLADRLAAESNHALEEDSSCAAADGREWWCVEGEYVATRELAGRCLDDDAVIGCRRYRLLQSTPMQERLT